MFSRALEHSIYYSIYYFASLYIHTEDGTITTMKEMELAENTSTPLSARKCVPCEGGMKPLARGEAEKLLTELDDWSLHSDGVLISKEFRFKDFVGALAFANRVGEIAEEENHHPDMLVSWGKVVVELSTHAVGGLSENDFILAAKIDQIQTK